MSWRGPIGAAGSSALVEKVAAKDKNEKPFVGIVSKGGSGLYIKMTHKGIEHDMIGARQEHGNTTKKSICIHRLRRAFRYRKYMFNSCSCGMEWYLSCRSLYPPGRAFPHTTAPSKVECRACQGQSHDVSLMLGCR